MDFGKAESGSAETSYKVLVSFVPDQDVSFGMGVVVTTLEGEYVDEETENDTETEQQAGRGGN